MPSGVTSIMPPQLSATRMVWKTGKAAVTWVRACSRIALCDRRVQNPHRLERRGAVQLPPRRLHQLLEEPAAEAQFHVASRCVRHAGRKSLKNRNESGTISATLPFQFATV